MPRPTSHHRTAPLTVLFVRHGETSANRRGLDRTAATPLSARGRAQAQRVAERLAHLSVNSLYASPHTRSLQTAEAIGRATTLPVETWDALVETRARGEDFTTLNERAARVLERLIERHLGETVVCVSHATMIEFLVAKAVFAERLTEEVIASVKRHFGTTNTGISRCAWTRVDGWMLETFNDAAHLS